jgi:hypothetical protein
LKITEEDGPIDRSVRFMVALVVVIISLALLVLIVIIDAILFTFPGEVKAWAQRAIHH